MKNEKKSDIKSFCYFTTVYFSTTKYELKNVYYLYFKDTTLYSNWPTPLKSADYFSKEGSA